MSLHQQTHPDFVEGCFGCKLASINISGAAMPTRVLANARYKSHDDWDNELSAYQTAIKHGIEPRSTKREDIEAARVAAGDYAKEEA